MRILELIESLGSGGAQRLVVDLCNEFYKSHNVAVGTLFDGDNCNFYEKDLNYKVKRFAYKFKTTKLLRIRQTFAVMNIIRRFKPDIVHLHDRAFIPGIIPSILYPKIKFFYTVHNIADKDGGKGIGAKLRKIFLKQIIKPIAISNYCAKSFEEYYGYKPYRTIDNGCRKIIVSDEIEVVRNEVRKYKPTPNTKIFLNIARFFEQKNHELLIESFNSMIKDGYNVLLLIIGSHPDENRKRYLESLVKDKKRIIFLGSKHNVQDYLSIADYFCLSSLWEGLPITILEAGLSGCYTVSTSVGGVPDIIQNEYVGQLSKDNSINSFRDTLIKCYNLHPDRTKIQEYFEKKYTITECANKYINAFLNK